MQSPIVGRNQVQPELDEVEEEVMDAIQEYRTTNFIRDFKGTYKNYYEDAQKQNQDINQATGANKNL